MLSHLGRFEIQAEIGRGGFGQVFRAHDPLMNRVVAVKMLTATEDAGSFNRFKNEATAAGNLRHENIVTVYEFGQHGHVPFLVMEYLHGEDLQNVIKNQIPLSLYQKVRIMDQVADGLHCAHSNGVLHRDVKPANIMLLRDGAVKIMDFGIARLVRDTSTRLTQQGYLIGTVVYMAPELFSSSETEVDALCDIWSYGVVMYELLAGKNPFQTGSLQSEMYRILNHDPAPLPPESCPPDLQAVISRLVSRQRGFRYQTLEETRFDLHPILNNLKKAEADRLVSLAQQMMFQRQWTEALDPAREARKMDPQNGTARIIFERIQDELRKQSVRPRIDDLLRRGNEAAEQRRIPEAINHLEAALKFDPTNENVLSRLQELRSFKVKLEEAVALVGQAGETFRAGHLTEAFEYASDAVSLDPDNREGRQLFDHIQSAIRDREAERALEAEMLRARGLMAIDDLDGAMATLKALESKHPGHNAVIGLTAQVAYRIAERDRRKEFSRRLDDAKAALRGSRFDQAVKELEQLLTSAPNEREIADLLAYARQELKAKERRDELKRVTDAAVESNGKQDFCEAIRILEDGLKKYPDDLALTRLLRSTYSELQNFEREHALRTGLERCDALRRSGKWQDALDLIGRLISDNPNNRDLADLNVKIKQEKKQQERAVLIRSALEEAQRLLRDRQPDAAVNVLETASVAAGPEPEIKELLKKAEEARQAERDRQYIESELKHARVFEERGDIPTSLKIIDGALRRSPKSPELSAARERLAALGVEAQRQQEVSGSASAIEELLKRKEWAKARERLDRAAKLFPSEGVFARLDEELGRRRKEHTDKLVSEGRRLLDAGGLEEAEQFLAANLSGYRDVPEVIKLERDIGTAKRQRESRAQAAAQEQLAPLRPDLPKAQSVANEPAAVEQKKQKLAAIGQALVESDWSRAMEIIEQAHQEYPNDPALPPLEARALDLRRAYLESAAAAIRSKLREKKLDDARNLFDQKLARYPEQNIVRAMAEEIAALQTLRATEEQKRALISESLKQSALCRQKGDSTGALAVLQKALKKYPGDPELSAEEKRVQDSISQAERARSLEEKTASIRREVESGNWQSALKRLAEVRATFPDNRPDFDGLERQASELRDRELKKLVEKATGFLKQGNRAEAERVLNKQLAPFAGEPAVAALANEIKEEKVRESLIEKARGHTAAGRFGEAEAAISELIAQRPKDPEEGRLRSALDAARKQDRKDKLYRTGRAEGAKLLRDRKYPEAIARFENLLTLFPGDRQLQQDLQGAIAAQRPESAPAQPSEVVPGSVSGPKPKWQIYGMAGVVVAALAGLALWMRPAAISVSPEKLSFACQPGAAPAAQTITVTGSSDAATPLKKADWLTVTRGQHGSGKTEFKVQVSLDKLSPGSYTERLTFSQDKKVVVDLLVRQPGFDIQPASLTFPYSAGGVAAQKIVVNSPAPIPNPKASERWVTFTRHNIGARKAEFLVQITANGLPPGLHSAFLTFTADQKVPVVLMIPGGSTSGVSPTLLAFPEGGAQQRVTFMGPGDIPDPQASEPWVTVTRGTVSPGRAEFLVQTSADDLEPGKHDAYLIFPSDKKVLVQLTVPEDTQALEVRPDSLRFPSGGLQQTVTVTGSADIPNPTVTDPWVKFTRRDLGAGISEFVVQASPAGLVAGPHVAYLNISSDKKVRIELTVGPAGAPPHPTDVPPKK